MSEESTQDKKDEHQTKADDRIYRVDVVSKPFDWRDGLYVIYILATATAAFIAWRALVAIKRQGGLMQEQLTQMREAGKQTDSLIQQTAEQVAALRIAAEAAVKNASAAETIAQSTTASAEAAQKTATTLLNAERAWIAIDISKTWNDRFTCSLVNYGKTPAKIITVEWQLIARESADNLPNEFRKVNVPPLVGREEPFEFANFSFQDFQSAWPQILTHKRIAILYGVVRYVDVVNETAICETSFRYLYNVGSQMFLIGPSECNKHT